MTWEEDALCRQVDPDAWFPAVNASPVDVAAVKKICRTCPSQEPCLSLAVENREEHGIWAGMTPRQLRKLWKEPA